MAATPAGSAARGMNPGGVPAISRGSRSAPPEPMGGRAAHPRSQWGVAQRTPGTQCRSRSAHGAEGVREMMSRSAPQLDCLAALPVLLAASAAVWIVLGVLLVVGLLVGA